MKQFKKRTLALILASVVTVTGSFAAEKYKNSLMALNFETNPNGSINMIVETKGPYSGSIVPIKKAHNTFVLMLPEVNSYAPTPDLETTTNNIESVSIRTMPYSNSGKGYTRITIKTLDGANITGTNKIYIPAADSEAPLLEDSSVKNETSPRYSAETTIKDEFDSIRRNRENRTSIDKDIQTNRSTETITETTEKQVVQNEPPKIVESYNEESTPDNSNEILLLVLSILLIITCILFVYVKAKNQLTEIAGERLDIDIEDDENSTKENKDKNLKKIKETVKKLDKIYPKTATRGSYIPKNEPQAPKFKPAENKDIVDLDKLFQKQEISKKQNEIDEEENLALEEFLSGFSFYEEEPIEEDNFDEETYQHIINSNIHFTESDINCINKLLNSEIDDDILKNIEHYAISNPIKKKLSQTEILEKFVLDYTINQNITFNEDDISALRKLISVELDVDFITNLRTDSKRLIEMQQDIMLSKEKKRPSKIKTLKVKNELPNLANELKKQGNQRIESNYRPETIYFEQGYNVSTLSIKEQLPDLSKELTLEQSQKTTPIEYNYIDSSYEVPTLKVSETLAELKKQPTEISKKEKENNNFTVDKDKLIENIQNVKLKPIDSKTQKIEILNDFALESNSGISENKGQNNKISEEMLKKMANTVVERDFTVKTDIKTNTKNIKPKDVQQAKKIDATNSIYVVENSSYTVINSVQLIENIGCHLAKNENGYTILSYNGDKISKIKDLENVRSERIQARLSEKLEDNTLRYIIRVGDSKIIVEVKDNSVKYLMDLC